MASKRVPFWLYVAGRFALNLLIVCSFPLWIIPALVFLFAMCAADAFATQYARISMDYRVRHYRILEQERKAQEANRD